MEKSGRPLDKRWTLVFFSVAALVAVADQLSKLWISLNLYLGQSIPGTGFLRITLVHNSGAAFGLFPRQSFPLTIVAILGIIVLLAYVFYIQYRLPFLTQRPGRLALGLILGGIIGNLIDRLRFGYVVDFIDIGIWPSFNIADSAVVVGVILFAYSLYFTNKAEKQKESEVNKRA